MEATSALLHSRTVQFGFALPNNPHFSLRHFNKQVESPNHYQTLKPTKNPLKRSFPLSSLSHQRRTSTHILPPLNCSCSDTTSSESQNPFLKHFKNLSFDSLKLSFSQLTPIGIIKWSAIISVAIAAAKWTVNLAFNPFFWMYFSWTWVFWPWYVALAVGGYGLYCLRKHSLGEANVFEQLGIVTSAFTWLTLVPTAHFNGFLEGWPFVFFFVYHYFFFLNVSIRRRIYGDYYVPPHDPKWDVSLPVWQRLLFCVGVTAGHWLAAFEGQELHLVPSGWSNVWFWLLIVVTLLMQYNSTWYLAKYSEKVVVPLTVVQFGPYRLVRHPIYASTMLLFVTYCAALRAPWSMLFTIGVCLLYYNQKAKLEEALMVENFGEMYWEYARRVRYKFIPLLF